MAISTVSGELALDPLITCKLCLCEYSMKDLHQMQGCSCVYCLSCLRQYLSILIQEGAVSSVTCPDAACREKGKIHGNEVKLLVGNDVFERYKHVKFELEVDLDPNRTWCPEVGCETICHVCTGDPSKAKPVHCPTCGTNFCSICKSNWHANLSCGEYMGTLTHKAGSSSSQVLEALGIPFDNEEVAKIKRCPMCHIPIERDEGCAQMMCKRCKHVFCWYCLANLDDDFLLRHYDKGPCKNKLGHSRASVIWHRTQVVGIFAGFGLLLLLASPFLLLVAPCILCCKCKWCRCCDEDDDLPPA
ncbi:probable E3 ubiquitin-protein ligase RNF144A [Patiria miniata]|uniref:E3 ubiquitin-protein ligase RNF144B n=1 Tax=Patiria miniata TaxID=46514 RepID=A0A914A1E9_PATMI|nr:probable E3 ubiquitin-protein ligase RNF144A [Patiria miniata]XP_038057466.1 probable E3 ubiquitin-protein ligase RNF144A [Patiria miniata]